MQDIKDYELDPNFAVVYSFLNTFGKHIGEEYENITIKEFKEFLEAKSVEEGNIFVRLHARCLRGIGNKVKNVDWQKAVIKFCEDFPDGDGKLLKKKGYFNVPVEVKLRILKNLCEDQFEFNDTFNKRVNEALQQGQEADCFRENLLGQDRLGRKYWFHLDHEGTVYVYRGWRNELTEEETWNLVCRDHTEMQELIQTLEDSDDLVQDDPHLREGKSGENPANIEIDPTGPDDVAEIMYQSQVPKHVQFYKVPKPHSLEMIQSEEKQHGLNHCCVKLERLKESVCCRGEDSSNTRTEVSALIESQALCTGEQKSSKPNKIVDEGSKDIENEISPVKAPTSSAITDGQSSVTHDVKQNTTFETDNILKSHCIDENKVEVDDKKETKPHVKEWAQHSKEATPNKSESITEDNGKNIFKDCIVKLEKLASDSSKDILNNSKLKADTEALCSDKKMRTCVVKLEKLETSVSGNRVGLKCENDAQDKGDNKSHTCDKSKEIINNSVGEVVKTKHKNEVNTRDQKSVESSPEKNKLESCKVTLEKLSPGSIKKSTEIGNIDESSSSSSCFSAGFEEISDTEIPQLSVNSVENSSSRSNSRSNSNSGHSEEGFEEISEAEIQEIKKQGNETGDIKSSEIKDEKSLSDRTSQSANANMNTSMDIDKQNIDNALKDLLSLEEIIKHGKEFDQQECKCNPNCGLGSKTSCETCKQSVNSAAGKGESVKTEEESKSTCNLDKLEPGNTVTGTGFTDHSIDKLCNEETNIHVEGESIKSLDKSTDPDVMNKNSYSVFVLKPTSMDKLIPEPKLLQPIRKDECELVGKRVSNQEPKHSNADMKQMLKSKIYPPLELKSKLNQDNNNKVIKLNKEIMKNPSNVNTDKPGDKEGKIDETKNVNKETERENDTSGTSKKTAVDKYPPLSSTTWVKGDKKVVSMRVNGENIYIEENQDENEDTDIDVVDTGSDSEKVHHSKSETDSAVESEAEVEIVSVDAKSEEKRKKRLYKTSDRGQKLTKNQRDVMFPSVSLCSVGSSVSVTSSFTSIPVTVSAVSVTTSTSLTTHVPVLSSKGPKVVKTVLPSAPAVHSSTATQTKNTKQHRVIKIIKVSRPSHGNALSQSTIQAQGGHQQPVVRPSQPSVVVSAPSTTAGMFVPITNVLPSHKTIYIEKSLLSKPNLFLTNSLTTYPPIMYGMPTAMLSAGSTVSPVVPPANISGLFGQPVVHSVFTNPVITSLTPTVATPTISRILMAGPMTNPGRNISTYAPLQTTKMVHVLKAGNAHKLQPNSNFRTKMVRSKLKDKLTKKKCESQTSSLTSPTKNHSSDSSLQTDKKVKSKPKTENAKIVKSKPKAENAKKKRKTGKSQICEASDSSESDKDLVIEEEAETDHDEEEETDSEYDYESISRRVRAAKKGESSVKVSQEDMNGSGAESTEELEEHTEPLEFGRNAKLIANTVGVFCLNEYSEDEEDPKTACSVCSKRDHPASLLTCDTCDACYHLACLSPPLSLVPLGDWKCPECDHERLIGCLKNQFEKVRRYYYRNKRKQTNKSNIIEKDRSGSVTQNMFRITEANILTKRSCRSQKEVNYSYSNYDKLVKEAVKNGEISSSESEAENDTASVRKPTSKPRNVKQDTKPIKKSSKAKHKNTRSKSKEGPTAAKKQKLTRSNDSDTSDQDESDYNCSDSSVSSEDYAEPEEDKTVEKPRAPEDDIYYTVSGRKTNSMSRVSKYL